MDASIQFIYLRFGETVIFIAALSALIIWDGTRDQLHWFWALFSIMFEMFKIVAIHLY